SWKLAKGLYIVPVIMAYTPFLAGDPLVALRIFALSVFGVYALAAALQGCMERPIGWIERGVIAVAGIACLWPGDILVNLAGVAAVILFLILNLRKPLGAPVPP
ncbi:MAG: TRAP transporter permease, partial [Boseongicola sp.]|nr:TRAP transporter permease [Boseongicola sp.]